MSASISTVRRTLSGYRVGPTGLLPRLYSTSRVRIVHASCDPMLTIAAICASLVGSTIRERQVLRASSGPSEEPNRSFAQRSADSERFYTAAGEGTHGQDHNQWRWP